MKHASFFPFIVLALTLVLVGGFVFLSSEKQATHVQTSVVSDTPYEDGLTIVLKRFFSVYDSATSDTAREQIVQSTLNALLSMRVPVKEKDLHLGLAISLQKIKQGLVSNPQDVSDGYAELKDFVSQTSWLHL